MAINPSVVINYISRRINWVNRYLPFSQDDIMNVVYDESLITFSEYFPYMKQVTLDCKHDAIPGTLNKFSIRGIEGLEVLGINKFYINNYTNSVNNDYYTTYNTNIFDLQVNTNLVSMARIPETFNFTPPNIVEIFPKALRSAELLLELKCVHPRPLVTIPSGLREYFLKLCLYDVQSTIYENLKPYEELNTAFGEVSLKISDLSEAESKKEELLEKFESKYIKEANRKKMYIY